VGLTAQYGPWVLNPVLIALWVVSVALWTAVARFKKVVHE
jgi:hypothetical protein